MSYEEQLAFVQVYPWFPYAVIALGLLALYGLNKARYQAFWRSLTQRNRAADTASTPAAAAATEEAAMEPICARCGIEITRKPQRHFGRFYHGLCLEKELRKE